MCSLLAKIFILFKMGRSLLKPLSPRSVRNAQGTLSPLMGWAIEEDLVSKNVVCAVKTLNPEMPTIKAFDAVHVRSSLGQVGQRSMTELRCHDENFVAKLRGLSMMVAKPISSCPANQCEISVRQPQ